MRAVICAGGEPPAEETARPYLERADLLLGADAGIEWMLAMGVTPHVAVGDFDSSGQQLRQRLEGMGVRILSAPSEKADTDSMMAARFVCDAHAEEAVLLGCAGRRLDHTYANLQVLYFLAQHMDVRMVDDWTCTRIVRGRFTVEGEKGMTFSVLPFMGEGEYTLLEGRIKYPVDHLRSRPATQPG